MTGEVLLITSERESQRATEVSAQVSGSTPYISGGLSHSARREMSNTEQNSYLLFKLQYRGRFESLSNPEITALGRSGVGSFADRCGDRYIRARQFGGIFYGIAEISKVTESNKRQIQNTVTNLSSAYVPGVTAGGGFNISSSDRQQLGISRIQLLREGGAEGTFPMSIEGLIEASNQFSRTVSENQTAIVAYLKDYRGLASAEDAPINAADERVVSAINAANQGVTTANDQIRRIDGYPAFQRSGLAGQRTLLSQFVTTAEAAIQVCRIQPENCDYSTLGRVPPSVELPDIVNITPNWQINKRYTVGVYNANVYCNFAQYQRATLSSTAISGVYFEFISADAAGMARMWISEYRAWSPRDPRSYEHEVPIHELAPYLSDIVAQRMSNTAIAAMVQGVFGPRTSGDGNWAFNSCFTP